MPVEGLHGLAVRLEALMTEIDDDDVMLDRTTMRRLRAFGRALHGSAAPTRVVAYIAEYEIIAVRAAKQANLPPMRPKGATVGGR